MNLALKPKFLFPGQQEHEQILLVTRKHWMVLAKEVAVWLLFVAILMLFDNVVIPHYPILTRAPMIQIVNLVKSIYLMFLVGGIFTIWILYYLNYQIVTNERVVDVDQKSLLHHSTTEVHLSQVEDVTSEIKGFLGNFLNYGHVYVQTAGAKARFEFDYVPNPNAVVKLILDLYAQLPEEKKAKDNA